MTVIPIIRMDRVGRIAPHRPNPLLASHAALFLAVHAFNTDRLPGTASEDDVRQITQQLRDILDAVGRLTEAVANEIYDSVRGSRLNPPMIAAILRDTLNDDVLSPLEAVAELARVATLQAAE